MSVYIDLSQDGERFQFFTSTINPATGEPVYNEPSGDAYVTLRTMGPFIEERNAKLKKRVEHVLNPKTRQMERISYYPEQTPEEEQAERLALWDYCIVSFEGFKDQKTKKEIKCTPETKLAMMKNPVFDRFVSRCFQIMAQSGIEAAQAEEKNSSTGSSSKTA